MSNSSKALPAADQATDESVKESFPASDPPASHLPDVPPANADAKWAAAGIRRSSVPPAPTQEPLERDPDDPPAGQ